MPRSEPSSVYHELHLCRGHRVTRASPRKSYMCVMKGNIGGESSRLCTLALIQRCLRAHMAWPFGHDSINLTHLLKQTMSQAMAFWQARLSGWPAIRGLKMTVCPLFAGLAPEYGGRPYSINQLRQCARRSHLWSVRRAWGQVGASSALHSLKAACYRTERRT